MFPLSKKGLNCEKKNKKKICVACNEDGFGPSAFAYYLVHAIIKEWEKNEYNFELEIPVLNTSAYHFNESIYSRFQHIVHPSSLKHDSLIKLEKPNGEVAVRETLKILKNYKKAGKKYLDEVRDYLSDADIAIDIGVPLFVHSAKELGVKHRITLFDHSWAVTLRLICAKRWEHIYKLNPIPTDYEREDAEKIAGYIEEDERCATEVYLFDSYITPNEFLDHWEKIATPTILKGVLGCKSNPKVAKDILNGLLKELRQPTVPDDKKLVLISPGGTPVWSSLLPHMIGQFVSSKITREYIPVLSNPKTADDKMIDFLKEKMRKSDKIRWFEFVKGNTQQIIMPAFDLIVTRAGGGTVNDALAAERCFICVEEPQVQVVLIEQECVKLGLIPDLPETRIDKFKRNPIGCIDSFFDFFSNKNNGFHCKFGIKAGVERELARDILRRL